VSSKNVSGGRFDPFFYGAEFEVLEKALFSSIFQSNTLGKLIIDLKNGVEIRNYTDSGFRYLRVSDLGKNGIVDNHLRFVTIDEIPSKILLNKSCILVARSGSLGLVNVVTDDLLNCILSSHIFKIELNVTKVIPEYLEVFFRSVLGQRQFFRINNGGVIPEINQTALKTMIIPLPPLSKQTAIAQHINTLRQAAAALESEVKAGLEKAKAEVERMILGE
jgi:restriction endonuclease S subunit